MAQTLPRDQNSIGDGDLGSVDRLVPDDDSLALEVPDARTVTCPTCHAGPGLACEDGIVHLGRAAVAAFAALDQCKAHHPASRFRR